MEELVYGLDFGTTNSAVAIRRQDKVEVLPIGLNGAKTVRTVLYFPDDEKRYYVGEEAMLRYVENGMHGRFLQSVKSLFPDPNFRGTSIRGFGNQQVYELASKIIRDLKTRADDLVGCKVTSVVVGRPAVFSEDLEREKLAEERLLAAVKDAGFSNITA